MFSADLATMFTGVFVGPALRFVKAVKRLFLSYIKYHNQKEKSFGYKLDCPLHIMLTSLSKGLHPFFFSKTKLAYAPAKQQRTEVQRP